MFSSSPEVPTAAQSPNPTPTVPMSATKLAPDATVAGVVITLMLSLALIVCGVRKYRAVQRSRLLKRQIAILEALWRISSTK